MTKKGKTKHKLAKRILAERPATKCETAGETTTDMQPEPLPITPPPAVPATGEKLIPPRVPESIAPPDDDDLFSQIREAGTVNGKPRFLIRSTAVINFKSDFLHKLLCDGLTFTAGHACVFSCLFCYVIEQMRKNAKFNALLQARGLRHEDVVVEIEDAAAMARQALTFADGTPRFT